MKRVFFIGLVLFAVSMTPAHAQTATDVNEGLRLTPGATVGTQVLSWWGKAGRTYFVQQSYDLITWTYLPVVHSGVGAPDGLNFACTDSRQFWRLRYPDPSPGGVSGAAGDADGDGRTNQAELNSGTDPLNADTDGDGWNDSLEFTIGSDGADAASTPPGVDPDFIDWIRRYDVETMTAGESYWMDWHATGRNAGEEWWWSQSWYLPGDVNHSGGKTGSKPTITYHGFPLTALVTDNPWQSSGALSFQQWPLPDYSNDNLGYNPTAGMQDVEAFSATTYKYDTAGWNCRWYRYRLRLSETLPYDYSESYLAIVHQYLPNPDYGLGGPTTDYRWVRSGIREVTPMTLTIPAGERTGAWKFQSPTVDGAGTYVALQVVPLQILQIPLAPDRINLAQYNFNVAPISHTPAPRFARWRNGFTDPGGQFKQDWIKNDPDRVIIRIGGDVIDPAVPLLNVKMKNISGVSGRTTDAGFLDLTRKSGGWETEPFLFVTDDTDDTQYNGDQGVDDNQHDQTRFAGFGAEINIKAQFKGQAVPSDISISTMYQAENTVKVQVNVFQGVAVVTAGDKANAQAAFDAARLLYRQIGVDLVQQGDVNVVNLPAGFANFIAQNGGYIDYSTPLDWADEIPTGQKFADYLVNLSAGTTAIKLLYTTANLKDYANVMGESGDPLGWAKLRGDYCIVELNQLSLRRGYVTAHEIGHVLGAQHPVGSFPYRIMNDTMPIQMPVDHTGQRRFSEADEQAFVGGKFYE